MENKDLQTIETFLCDQFEIAEPTESNLPEGQTRFDEMRSMLIQRLDEMIFGDLEGLMSLLYRIDVSESRLKEQLAAETDRSAAEVMADMIIDRQLQKIKTRKQFGGETGDWSFDV